MACGAGLPVLAVATTVSHFVIMFVFPKLIRQLPRPQRVATEIRISYEDGRGLLRTILMACTELRFTINHVRLNQESRIIGSREEAQDLADYEGVALEPEAGKGTVALCMQVKGKKPISHLIAKLTAIDGIREVGTMNEDSGLD